MTLLPMNLGKVKEMTDHNFIEEVPPGRSLNVDCGDQVNPLPFYIVVNVS